MVDALASRAEEGRDLAAKSYDQALVAVVVDVRMGQPLSRYGERHREVRQAVELKHLSRPRKRDYSLSSGERTGRSPNQSCVSNFGVMDHHKRVRNRRLDERPWKGLPQRVKAP